MHPLCVSIEFENPDENLLWHEKVEEEAEARRTFFAFYVGGERRGGGGVRESWLGKFGRSDGDHALRWRVLRMLVE